ncbi:hypothetical protein C8J56DRAFT_918918 [Mycena floridula]|nr:hypothetical protein C8J56DRAFT_918918 [Mycena floridula]
MSLEKFPRVGGKLAVVIFAFSLLGFVLESQLAQYVQKTGYRHPYFIFYLVHASFAVIFPLHLIFLYLFGGKSPSECIDGLKIAATKHLSKTPEDPRFPLRPFCVLILCLTTGATLPGLLWFAAVPLAPLGDVTAIWNTNSIFAYLISVKVFHLQWEARPLVAVFLSFAGVSIVVYGGSEKSKDPSTASLAPAPLLGDMLTLLASFSYGLYLVLYKKYAALPAEPALDYEQLPAFSEEETTTNSQAELRIDGPPPYGLYPNMLTSIIGLCTLFVLWIPIPLLHYTGLEPFAVPPDLTTTLLIASIALSGVVFNAGFMILLGIWGPIVTSVGGLLTIVLVSLSDILWSGLAVITLWSVVGCSVIVLAFAILVYDMSRTR